MGLDAKESIRDNPHIRTVWPLSEAMSLDLLDETVLADEGSKGGSVVRRPILSLSLALNYALLGPQAWGFHAVNLVIHCCAGLLLLGIARRTFALPRFRNLTGGRATPLAFAVAALWLVHPLQTESVTYLPQRAESMMGMLYLATVYCALRGFGDRERRALWFATSILACGLGMGTKETMATAPLIVLLYDHTFVSTSIAAALRRHRGLYIGLAATWLVLVVLIILTAEDAARDFREGRTLAYALSQPAVIWHYLRLAVWPDALHLYVNTEAFNFRPGSSSIAQVALLATPMAGLAVAGAWLLARRSWLGFMAAVFFVTLAPTSSIVATSDVIQQHRTYLALIAVIVPLVVCAEMLVQRLLQDDVARSTARIAATGLVLIALVGRTWARNADYHDEFSMVYPRDLQEAYSILVDHEIRTRDSETLKEEWLALLDSRTSNDDEIAYAHFALGDVHERERDLERSLAHFREAIRLQPDLPHAHTQLGAVLLQLGRAEEAAKSLERALQITPAFAAAHTELGAATKALGDGEAAEKHFLRAAELQPSHPDAYAELAILYTERGDLDAARRQLERALEVRPRYARGHHELAMLLESQGLPSAAREHFTRAAALLSDVLDRYPDRAETHYELGMVLARLGRPDQARQHIARAIDLRPGFADAHKELAILDREKHGLAAAVAQLREAVRNEPDVAETHYELALLLRRMNDLEGALAELDAAVALRPDYVPARIERGAMLLEDGRAEDALTDLQRTLELAPDSVAAIMHFAQALAALDRGDEARRQLRRAVRLQPDYVPAHVELGVLLAAVGDLEGARRRLERAAELAPGDASVQLELAIVLRDQGDREGASTRLERALEIDPGFSAAREELELLRDGGSSIP